MLYPYFVSTVFCLIILYLFAEMAPPIEIAATKSYAEKQASLPLLNERILSSMTHRSVAAHPWHDLEIGMQLYNVT